MEYTGKHKHMYSETLDEEVDILEYKSDDNIPYCDCSRCGKPIRHTMYVVQSSDTGIEELYLGAECIRKFH